VSRFILGRRDRAARRQAAAAICWLRLAAALGLLLLRAPTSAAPRSRSTRAISASVRRGRSGCSAGFGSGPPGSAPRELPQAAGRQPPRLLYAGSARAVDARSPEKVSTYVHFDELAQQQYAVRQ
jgi:hypothetical protein